MNQHQPYMDMHHGSHMTSGPPYSHHPATAAPMQHYPPYQQPVMAHGPQYGPPSSYPNYNYANGVTSPQSTTGPLGQGRLELPGMMPHPSPHNSYPPANPPPTQGYTPTSTPYDTTGQLAPPGMKPRVTATLWEDEGSLCFQVEAKGVCVARREDNHFINGTKLLNVAGMTRGRRDGILKSEKLRHVVKIGPMHLKGVWIPFERALDFANKEKITDLLYPLFVHNIGGMLYNAENASRTNAVVAASERRRMDSVDGGRPPSSHHTPTLPHHHSMQGPVGGQAPPTPHSIAPHPNAGRPGIDRAHTFPTPPTSASSVMGMHQGNSYEWGGQNIPNGVNGNQPLAIDTRSMPTTPATTPPSQTPQTMPGYQGQSAYDKNAYNTTPGSQQGYAAHSDPARYGSAPAYPKTEMPPPHPPATAAPGDPHEQHHVHGSGHPEHDVGEHAENGYMHTNSGQYATGRDQYGYGTAPQPPHLSPEMTGSPHQTGSGRGTPRTLPPSQSQWSQDYQTPPRPGASSNVYNVMGSTGSNGPSSGGTYPSSAYSATAGIKRGRDEDEGDRPASRDFDYAKRQKTGRQDNFGMQLNAPHMQAIKTGGQR